MADGLKRGNPPAYLTGRVWFAFFTTHIRPMDEELNMGRMTEWIHFITCDELPTPYSRDHIYTHMTETDELKKVRREYKAAKRKRVAGNQE